jgi:hypothetical protein
MTAKGRLLPAGQGQDRPRVACHLPNFAIACKVVLRENKLAQRPVRTIYKKALMLLCLLISQFKLILQEGTRLWQRRGNRQPYRSPPWLQTP